MLKWADSSTFRQLVVMTTVSDLVSEARDRSTYMPRPPDPLMTQMALTQEGAEPAHTLKPLVSTWRALSAGSPATTTPFATGTSSEEA